MNGKIYYGLLSQNQLREMALKVCECLGNGKNNTAYNLLLETAGAETVRGGFFDSTKGAGMGLTQFDKMPWHDTHNRTSKNIKILVFNYFGIYLDYLEWEDLRYNPLLAMICTRLKYRLIAEEIPISIEDRAKYWKKYYNSELGKGTIEHYLSANEKFLENDERFLNANKRGF